MSKKNNSIQKTLKYRFPTNPESDQDQKTWVGVLKGGINRAYKLCSKPKTTKGKAMFFKAKIQRQWLQRKKKILKKLKKNTWIA